MTDVPYASLLGTVDWLRACLAGDLSATGAVRQAISDEALIAGLTSACLGSLAGSTEDPQDALDLLHAVLTATPEDVLPSNMAIDPATGFVIGLPVVTRAR